MKNKLHNINKQNNKSNSRQICLLLLVGSSDRKDETSKLKQQKSNDDINMKWPWHGLGSQLTNLFKNLEVQ